MDIVLSVFIFLFISVGKMGRYSTLLGFIWLKKEGFCGGYSLR